MRVGIVDDDLSLAELLADKVEQETKVTDSPEMALEWVEQSRVDCLITDLRMPEVGGLELLERVRELSAELPVIVITGHGSIDTAVEAMKQGAWDYLEKPVGGDEIQIIVDRIAEELKRANQLEGLRESQRSLLEEEKLVGDSEAMREVQDLIDKVAPESSNVLIEGETGTGKELIARAIHSRGPRFGAPFMAINCAAIPAELLESELFGHEKGAFTGADETKKGKIELADGGTLFLDEIGELALELQPKLLRVLEQGNLSRLGGEVKKEVDVRLVAATNRQLSELVKADEFRRDLFYRVNTIKITAPPLRNHREDIPELIDYFAQVEAWDVNSDNFSEAALEAMKSYRWPGNVRELRNILERVIVLTTGEEIKLSDLPAELQAPGPEPAGEEVESINWQKYGDELPQILNNLETKIIESVLRECDGNKSEAARRLGISRQSLHYKLENNPAE